MSLDGDAPLLENVAAGRPTFPLMLLEASVKKRKTLVDIGMELQRDCHPKRPIMFVNQWYAGMGSLLSQAMVEIPFGWSQGYRVSFIPPNVNYSSATVLEHEKDAYFDPALCPGKNTLSCYFDFKIDPACISDEELLRRFNSAKLFWHPLEPYPLDARLSANVSLPDVYVAGYFNRPWYEGKFKVQM
jgi:hypothetical protein